MLKFHPDMCTGCEICEMACSLHHENNFNVKLSRVRIYREHIAEVTAEYCRQCSARHCVDACDASALFISERGHVALDPERCTGCLACSEACPFGQLPTNAGYPQFCDTCDGAYQCTRWCPTGALVLKGPSE